MSLAPSVKKLLCKLKLEKVYIFFCLYSWNQNNFKTLFLNHPWKQILNIYFVAILEFDTSVKKLSL